MPQLSSGPFPRRRLEIRAAEFTTGDVGDAPMLPELLDQIPPEQEIATVTADGAFDTRKCHDAIAARGTAALAIVLEPMAHQWLAPAPQECQTLEARHRRSHRTQRDPAHIKAYRSNHMATMVRGRPATGSRAAPNAITAEAAPRPGCIASSAWAIASPRASSTVRSPSSRSVLLSSTASPRSASPSRKPWAESVRGKGNPVRHPICATELRRTGTGAMVQELHVGVDVARDWLDIHHRHRGARRIDTAPSALKAIAATCAREGAWSVSSRRPRRTTAARASAASRASADARGPVSTRGRWSSRRAGATITACAWRSRRPGCVSAGSTRARRATSPARWA